MPRTRHRTRHVSILDPAERVQIKRTGVTGGQSRSTANPNPSAYMQRTRHVSNLAPLNTAENHRRMRINARKYQTHQDELGRMNWVEPYVARCSANAVVRVASRVAERSVVTARVLAVKVGAAGVVALDGGHQVTSQEEEQQSCLASLFPAQNNTATATLQRWFVQ